MAYAPVITMQPFRFHSIYQPRIWGGQHMRTMLGRELPDRETAYGEAWEISDRPEAMSTVREGEWEGIPLHRLWEERREELFGPGYERFTRFPLLCKILDARENLSVQVHPPERTAAARRGEVKNEVWYVLHADPDALIYGGMEETATLSDIRRAAETGQMEQLIRSTHLEKGEHLYIPAGLVHAIGAGHLIAEIQQNSDTTYRLYDWNRTDASGQGRELHMEQALDSIAEFRELPAARLPDGNAAFHHGGISAGPGRKIHPAGRLPLRHLHGSPRLRVLGRENGAAGRIHPVSGKCGRRHRRGTGYRFALNNGLNGPI